MLRTNFGKMTFFGTSLVFLFISLIKGRKIPLHDRTGEITGYAIVSSKDYEKLNNRKWHISRGGYVRGSMEGHNWSLHRYIMIVLMGKRISSEVRVDHINNKKFDNRRSNLRPLTSVEDRKRRKKKGVQVYILG
jgi:hypothetical protein